MTGTKYGCGIAQCGACTVHIDGDAVRSCQTTIGALGAGKVTTIEGVGDTPTGAKVQAAWLGKEVVQCGYCQSGQIMSAAALLDHIPNPSDAAMRCPAIFAAAAHTSAFARRSMQRQRRKVT